MLSSSKDEGHVFSQSPAQMATRFFRNSAVKFGKNIFFALIALLLALSRTALAELPGHWQSRAPMPSARTEVAAVELGGKIYVIGGYEKGSNLVEEYDPASDRWRGRASLPKPLHHVGAAAVNGKIFVIGGYVSGTGSMDTVYEYDPAADRWNVKTAMPTARGALAVGIIGEKIMPSAVSVIMEKTSMPMRNMIPRKIVGPGERPFSHRVITLLLEL